MAPELRHTGQAAIFALDVQRLAGDDDAARVGLALARVTQRDATAGEVERGVAFIHRMQAEHGAPPDEAWQKFCLLAMNMSEFLYLD